jgi:signal transduction histidine kinase
MDLLNVKAQVDKESEATDALGWAENAGGLLTCGILAVDNEQRVCALNAEAERLIGSKASQLQYVTSDVLPAPLREVIRETIQIGQAIAGRQVILSEPGAPERKVQVQSTLSGARGEAHGVILVLADLHRAFQLGMDMQRLDRLASIGTLAASMAHEIKNAMVAIKTFVDELVQRNRDAELSGLASRELRRVDAIVSQMLRFAGPGKPTFSPISLHRVLDHSLRLMQPQIESKRVRLRRSFLAHPDVVNGDGYQIEQVFLNLFLNALAAMEPEGLLSVSTEIVRSAPHGDELREESPEPMFQVTVTDTGPGIAPEVLARLFEPFFTTKPQGTGLGLAITRRIVTEHRGKISVESEPDRGATFRVMLPLR